MERPDKETLTIEFKSDKKCYSMSKLYEELVGLAKKRIPGDSLFLMCQRIPYAAPCFHNISSDFLFFAYFISYVFHFYVFRKFSSYNWRK